MSQLQEHKKKALQYQFKRYGVGLLFMLPWMIGFSVFVAIPIGWSMFMSLHKVAVVPGGFKYDWIGIQNYRDAFLKDNVFPIEMITYFQQMLLMVPIIVIFALLISLLLNQKFPGRFIYRALFFLPVIFATGQVLSELFTQGAGDIPFLDQYNLEPLVKQYVGGEMAKMIMEVLGRVVLILWYSGVQILIFIAGFQTISPSIYEAVRIDGASPWDSFWKITLPASIPFISLNVLYTIIDLFTFPLNPVLKHIRDNMFKVDTGYGYASALAWIYFGFIFVLIAIVLGMFSRSMRQRGRRS
ncbi:sugar ABC transporter permease [Paenibacillus taichungensis]|jgi:ABC-type sugar transport system permease subunit|nr:MULTISPECIES: sugar ABC transporter permease [Paenibacillus]MEC0110080.1 sugar ABC transporter permease [Paenibacillus taichungensis]MEC0199094.1 sugar ABC transporter permease [Paenibacillus taichungensis]OAX48293.1 L-arabinose transport system permease protein AraP [Paenibacillus sp. AD87]